MGLGKNKIIYSITAVVVMSIYCLPLKKILPIPLIKVIIYMNMMFLSILVIVKNYKHFFLRKIVILFIYVSFFSILIIVVLFSRTVSWGGYFGIGKQLLFLFELLLLYFMTDSIEFLREKDKEKLVKLYLVSVALTQIYSLYHIYFIDELSVRNALFFDEGVADFVFVNSLVFKPFIISEINPKIKSVSTFLDLIFLLKAGFMTALIFYMVAWIIVIIRPKIKTILLLGFVVALLLPFISEMLYMVSNISWVSWVISEKLKVLSNIMKGNLENLDTFGKRILLMRQSMSTFKQYYLVGIPINKYGKQYLGLHTHWIDLLAVYGITGFLVISSMYLLFYKSMNKQTKDSYLLKYSYLFFILFGFFNPIISTLMNFTFFFMLKIANLGGSQWKKVQ